MGRELKFTYGISGMLLAQRLFVDVTLSRTANMAGGTLRAVTLSRSTTVVHVPSDGFLGTPSRRHGCSIRWWRLVDAWHVLRLGTGLLSCDRPGIGTCSTTSKK